MSDMVHILSSCINKPVVEARAQYELYWVQGRGYDETVNICFI